MICADILPSLNEHKLKGGFFKKNILIFQGEDDIRTLVQNNGFASNGLAKQVNCSELHSMLTKNSQ